MPCRGSYTSKTGQKPAKAWERNQIRDTPTAACALAPGGIISTEISCPWRVSAASPSPGRVVCCRVAWLLFFVFPASHEHVKKWWPCCTSFWKLQLEDLFCERPAKQESTLYGGNHIGCSVWVDKGLVYILNKVGKSMWYFLACYLNRQTKFKKKKKTTKADFGKNDLGLKNYWNWTIFFY